MESQLLPFVPAHAVQPTHSESHMPNIRDSQVDDSFLPLLWDESFPHPPPGVYIFVKRRDKGHNNFALRIKVI